MSNLRYGLNPDRPALPTPEIEFFLPRSVTIRGWTRKHRAPMKLSELDYELPRDRIAQYPLPQRDASRMLVFDRTARTYDDRQFRELPDVLRGD